MRVPWSPPLRVARIGRVGVVELGDSDGDLGVAAYFSRKVGRCSSLCGLGLAYFYTRGDPGPAYGFRRKTSSCTPWLLG